MLKITENNWFVLYNSTELFLPENLIIFDFDSLVEVKAVNKIIFPIVLSYGNRQLYGILIPLYKVVLFSIKYFEFFLAYEFKL